VGGGDGALCRAPVFPPIVLLLEGDAIGVALLDVCKLELKGELLDVPCVAARGSCVFAGG
jgi:hypothetical protein